MNAVFLTGLQTSLPFAHVLLGH